MVPWSADAVPSAWPHFPLATRLGNSFSFHTQLSLPSPPWLVLMSVLPPCPWRPERGWILLLTCLCPHSTTSFCYLGAVGSWVPSTVFCTQQVSPHLEGWRTTGPVSLKYAQPLVISPVVLPLILGRLPPSSLREEPMVLPRAGAPMAGMGFHPRSVASLHGPLSPRGKGPCLLFAPHGLPGTSLHGCSSSPPFSPRQQQ